MKTFFVMMMVVAGTMLFASGAGAQTAGDAGTGAAGPGAAGDSSASETGPGDRLGGAAAGISGDPSIYRSPASAWPGETEYPSASPRSGVVVAPPATIVVPSGSGVVVDPAGRPVGAVVTPPAAVIVEPSGPLMCPGINAGDPRKC